MWVIIEPVCSIGCYRLSLSEADKLSKRYTKTGNALKQISDSFILNVCSWLLADSNYRFVISFQSWKIYGPAILNHKFKPPKSNFHFHLKANNYGFRYYWKAIVRWPRRCWTNCRPTDASFGRIIAHNAGEHIYLVSKNFDRLPWCLAVRIYIPVNKIYLFINHQSIFSAENCGNELLQNTQMHKCIAESSKYMVYKSVGWISSALVLFAECRTTFSAYAVRTLKNWISMHKKNTKKQNERL